MVELVYRFLLLDVDLVEVCQVKVLLLHALNSVVHQGGHLSNLLLSEAFEGGGSAVQILYKLLKFGDLALYLM